jgi:hypothetical protein
MIGSVLGGRMFEHELVIPFNLLPFGVFLCNFARHHRPVSFRTCELPRAAPILTATSDYMPNTRSCFFLQSFVRRVTSS